MQNKKILIIGGCGFVGANLASHLSDKFDISIADNLVRRGSEISLEEFKKQGISFTHCDIRCPEDFNNLGKYDVILNCAAQPSAINYSNPVFDITNNTIGVLNVLEYCRKTGAGLIQWSTNKCYSGVLVNSIPRITSKDYKARSRNYIEFFEWTENTSHRPIPGFDISKGFNENLSVDGNDHSIYGVSKIAADLLVQEWSDAFKINSIVNRFSCLAGPKQWGKAEQGWVTWFAIANELGLPIEIFGFNGMQVRDCLFADDLASLIEKQIYSISNYNGEVFNVGGGMNNALSLNKAIDLLENLNSVFVNIQNGPQRRADQAIYITDITKVSKEFNWKPMTSIEQGYSNILKWVKDNRSKLIDLYK